MSASAFNLILSALLARGLSSLDFALWSLALQSVAYINVFGAGIQVATAKFLAESQTAQDAPAKRRVVAAAGLISVIGALMALLGVAVLAALYPSIFSEIRGEDVNRFRLLIAVLCGSAALQLLAWVPVGVFMARQQNHVYILPQIAVRALTLWCVWLAVYWSADLLKISFAFAGGGLLFLPLVVWILLKREPWVLHRDVFNPRYEGVERVSKYCAGLVLWSLSSILLGAMDLALVGWLDLDMVAPYALALTLTGTITGLLAAVTQPLLPAVSSMHTSRAAHGSVVELLEQATFWCTVALQLGTIVLFTSGEWLLTMWVGATYAESATPVFQVLVLALAVRNIALPYSVFLLAVALHNRALKVVLIEGIVNLCASLILARYLGAYGIALGTLIGSIASVLVHVSVNFPQTRLLVPSTSRFLFRSVLRGVVVLVPFYAVAVFFNFARQDASFFGLPS